MPDPIIDPANPTPPAPAPAPVPSPPVADPVDQPLGEAGQRALIREREVAAEARREAAALKAELETLRTSQMSDQDKAIKAAKAEGAAEVSAKFATQVLHSEVRVAAAGKLADPSDAVRLLDLARFKVADDGTVDSAAITSAIDELVKSKPYLAPSAPSVKATDTGQGARNGNATVSQIRDREAIKKMTPDQIAAAHKAGQFDELMRGA